jgi:hypothetical protein
MQFNFFNFENGFYYKFIITSNYIFQAKLYSTNNIYGISQTPDTKDYIIVLKNVYCKECSELYTEVENKWCKPCQINNLKQNFANWTSGNEKIDYFIQDSQLKINTEISIIVEWIPYDQFKNIKNMYKDKFITINTAIWKDGPLKYNTEERKQLREPNKKVALKYLNNYQNNTNKFLNEVVNLIFSNF